MQIMKTRNVSLLAVVVGAVLWNQQPATPFAVRWQSHSCCSRHASTNISATKKRLVKSSRSSDTYLPRTFSLSWLAMTSTMEEEVEEEAETVAIAVEEQTIITNAASLLSYQCAEELLDKALAALHATITNTATTVATPSRDSNTNPLKITPLVRGQLEDFVVVDATTVDKNIVDIFLATLAAATTDSSERNASLPLTGLATCHFLLDRAIGNGEDEDAQLQFKPPIRSLIGTINGMDISLLRDKKDFHRRFSMSFSADRAKGQKLARLLAEIDDEGIVSIRGLYVHEEHRQAGLATLIISVFSHLCLLSFGSYPQTCKMNKPLLCVAFSTLGFQPETKKWPVLVAQHATDKDVTLMSRDGNGPDLGQQFPHNVRKAQKIEFVSCLPPETTSRKTFVLTKFLPPPPAVGPVNGEATMDPVMARLDHTRFQLFSARIVAFLSTLEYARDLMFQRSDQVMDEASGGPTGVTTHSIS